MPIPFHPGQRWISDGEPELGMGEVASLGERTVRMVFGATGETRDYALEGAPLRRVGFRIGDPLQDAQGGTWTVRAVAERNHLLHYDCGERTLCESELSHALPFSGPRERLLAGRFDGSAAFELRFSALKHQYRRRKSPVRGFQGGRIDLLPHQLSLASEVASRLNPRVLLADEVGLGKTIEAGLILHRLLLTGRARRVLILVPESLLHQWFVELLRRFSLWFSLFDEARCQAAEAASPGNNPFLEAQLILCEPGLFTRDPERLRQARDAGWDLLVVDEAHHLGWSPEGASPEYALVEALGRETPGLLLLTATPEQLGQAGHFARLRLLDPDRYADLPTFLRESEGYRAVAQLAEKLHAGIPLDPAEVAALAGVMREPEARLRDRLGRVEGGDAEARQELLTSLLDQHGTGRVMFRNTRATVAGFPRRQARLLPLAGDAEVLKGLVREWKGDVDEGAPFVPDLARDPRVIGLADLLRRLGTAKVLLICRTRRKAEALEAALRAHLRVKAALFHEGLTLVQRDRAAAWFADPEGARLLLCSEIGSEGRNFQFAHHLVLFDLPLDPGLLEQRIGRLDRIGQTADIQIHVPIVEGSPQAVHARWFHEGLAALETSLPGGRELLDRFSAELMDVALGHGDLEALLARTREARRDLTARLEAGRDRLLEWNAHKPEAAEALIAEIRKQDASPALDTFLLAVLEQHFIEVEELAPRTFQLGSAGVLVEDFPGLTADGLTVTCERARALAREDLQFLTWDHPLVTGALDLVLGGETGACAFARWPDPKGSALYLEAIFLLEAIAPPHLHVDRFLPPTPLRVLVDHRGADLTEALPHLALKPMLKAGEGHALLEQEELRGTVLPRMLAKVQRLAEAKAPGFVAQARKAAAGQLGRELTRLRELQRVNPAVRSEEVEALAQLQRDLDLHLREARLRLDALRLIHRGDLRGPATP
ncbi:MAG TPA: RNA polymerase-associated protein RapA [Holophagaceae bacterium]|nr:RNA polymerase-associated protein RapA [Holophagaceae bacterium]